MASRQRQWRSRRYGKALAVAALAVGVLVSSGCSGVAGGSGQSSPPPPQITLNGAGAWNVTDSGTDWVVAGTPSFLLLVSGKGFTSSSVVEWNGNALQTTFTDSEDLAAQVPASLVVLPGTAQLTVTDSSERVVSNAVSFGIASPSAATAGVVQMITVAPDGTPANGDSLVAPSISTTGRFIAFQSAATNLAPGPASGYQEIYERDTCIGAPAGCTPSTTRVTVTDDGTPANGHSRDSAISADGRYVAFDSQATNLVPNTASCIVPVGNMCVFLRDTCTGVAQGCIPSTTLLPLGGLGQISPDGRYLLLGGGTSNLPNVPSGELVLWDTCNGAPSGCVVSTPATALLISQSSSGDPANEIPTTGSLSPSGRYSAFGSWASNFGQQNENGWPGVFLRDDCIGASSGCTPSTIKIDDAPDGSVANGFSGEGGTPSVSADGRFVAFDSAAMNLVVPNLAQCDTGGSPPLSCGFIFLRDTCNGVATGCTPATSIVSLGNDGSLPNATAADEEGMSADGRFVSFASLANNLVPGDTFPVNDWKDIFVRDTCFGAPAGCNPSTVRVSVANYTGNFATQSNAINAYPRISGDGHYVVFLSAATNFLASGGNGHIMVYLAKTGF